MPTGGCGFHKTLSIKTRTHVHSTTTRLMQGMECQIKKNKRNKQYKTKCKDKSKKLQNEVEYILVL